MAMSLKELSRKNSVVQLQPDNTVAEACRLMEEKNVGCVVVTEHGRPVGILTDRDVVIRVVNKGLNVGSVPIRQAMTRDPIVFSEQLTIDRTMELIQKQGRAARRFPIVDGHGLVSGIVTVDDIVRHAGKEMHAIEEILEREMAHV
jgi:CBS domain-containing protein